MLVGALWWPLWGGQIVGVRAGLGIRMEGTEVRMEAGPGGGSVWGEVGGFLKKCKGGADRTHDGWTGRMTGGGW